MFESVAGLLRLLAVPLFGWAAVRDVRTRRVPNWVWYVLGVLGAVLLVVDVATWYPFADTMDQLRLTQVGVSLFFVAPLGYFFWRLGGFGGADAKALMALAVLYPVYPTFYPPRWLVDLGAPAVLPVQPTAIGVFSLTILTNTVVVGVCYPLALAVRNARAGRLGAQMFLARVVPVDSLPRHHGRLFEDREGFRRDGLDLDALRMYLRWRGLTLADLARDPTRYRFPESVGETHDPTDGAVDAEPARTDGGDRAGGTDGTDETDGTDRSRATPTGRTESPATDPDADATGEDATAEDATAGTDAAATTPADPWAAERFLDDVEGSAYGTDAATLREGIETALAREEVWISPGLPFIVPMFAGLVLALTYGDLLYGFLVLVGLG